MWAEVAGPRNSVGLLLVQIRAGRHRTNRILAVSLLDCSADDRNWPNLD